MVFGGFLPVHEFGQLIYLAAVLLYHVLMFEL
jgi:hypothetical protein